MAVFTRVALGTDAQVSPLSCLYAGGIISTRSGRAQARILVTQAAHPALPANTLPRFLTCAVQTAGEGHALVTVLSLPPWFAPALPGLLTKPIFCVAPRAAFPTFDDACHDQN